MRRGRMTVWAACVLAVSATMAGAQPGDRLGALAEPAYVAIMRHALAPGTGDPSGFDVTDCATQRNLDARGRAQARAIGAALREAGVVFDRILTSAWCRCRETADLLGMGPVEAMPALDSFYDDRSTAAEQTAALRVFLAGLHPGETVMLVTHQVNITALTGRSVASGEVFVIASGERAGDLIDRVLIAP